MSREVRRPDLSREERVAFDIETRDPNLKELGPGVYRKDGYVLGVSLATPGGFKEYYNLRHYDCSPDERGANINYLRAVLGDPRTTKVGQSIQYDIDWLENGEDKIKVNGPLVSVEIAEALLDETQGVYDLDFMGKKYLNRGKAKSSIERWCEQHELRGDPRAWLWKMPYATVREYGVEDAELPLEVWDVQRPMLEEQQMLSLNELECELVRCLVKMRKTGVLIDQDKRDRNALMVQSRIEELQQSLFARYGEFNANSSMQLAKIFDQEKIIYPYSVLYKDDEEPTKGVYLLPEQLRSDSRVVRFSPNIDDHFYTRFGKKEAPEKIPLVAEIFELRQNKSHLDKFLMGSHVKFVCPDGKIHAQFHNMRNDSEGVLRGTRSGRFSSTMPNLQQQPAIGVDEYWGRICREDFVPFPDCWWAKVDYSQIEYRFLAHFACGPGSEELRAAYNSNADQDYHQFIMDLTGLKRRYAKNLNFGVAFGMGAPHMAELFGWTVEYCREVLGIYHARAPYVRSTIEDVERVAKRRGWIKTFLGRRSHLKDKSKAYIMFCRLLQGSAADLMKMTMLKSYQAGLFDVLHLHATVHDELDVSVPKTRAGIEALKEMQHVMETCLTLKVPIKAEVGVGRNWAEGENKLESWEKLYEEVD